MKHSLARFIKPLNGRACSMTLLPAYTCDRQWIPHLINGEWIPPPQHISTISHSTSITSFFYHKNKILSTGSSHHSIPFPRIDQYYYIRIITTAKSISPRKVTRHFKNRHYSNHCAYLLMGSPTQDNVVASLADDLAKAACKVKVLI